MDGYLDNNSTNNYQQVDLDVLTSLKNEIEAQSNVENSFTPTPLDDLDVDNLQKINQTIFRSDAFKNHTLYFNEEIEQSLTETIDSALEKHNQTIEGLSTIEDILNFATLVAWNGTSNHNPIAALEVLASRPVNLIDLENPGPTKCNIFNGSVRELANILLKRKFGEDIFSKILVYDIGADFSQDLILPPYNYSATQMSHSQILLLTQTNQGLCYTILDPYFSRKTAKWPETLDEMKSIDKTSIRAISGHMNIFFNLKPQFIGSHVLRLIDMLKIYPATEELLKAIRTYLDVIKENRFEIGRTLTNQISEDIQKIKTDNQFVTNFSFNQINEQLQRNYGLVSFESAVAKFDQEFGITY
ncbi:hypothetical protein KC669_04085 [Candidatus Dojkabacteria bacterium]|uniref:Uncharacterized protein n=1 Tax=Candidatus Dojkabacteria bacterium TaxID=2099670 RepID=A0A955LAH7_9BACT|nr:hypothetical protein [Candidatus Dojkabacteria bacterium]